MDVCKKTRLSAEASTATPFYIIMERQKKKAAGREGKTKRYRDEKEKNCCSLRDTK